jgi:hypothetical protein
MDMINKNDVEFICNEFKSKMILDYQVLEYLLKQYGYDNLFVIIIDRIQVRHKLSDTYKRFLFVLRGIKNGVFNQAKIVSLYNGMYEYDDYTLVPLKEYLSKHIIVNEEFVYNRIRYLYETIHPVISNKVCKERQDRIIDLFQSRIMDFAEMVTCESTKRRNVFCKFILINGISKFIHDVKIRTILYNVLTLLFNPLFFKDMDTMDTLSIYNPLRLDIKADPPFYIRIVESHFALGLIKNYDSIDIVKDYLFSLVY